MRISDYIKCHTSTERKSSIVQKWKTAAALGIQRMKVRHAQVVWMKDDSSHSDLRQTVFRLSQTLFRLGQTWM